MKRHFDGFTLAEVLITLGIIGVVAAMTMPTLINQTNGAQYKAAYKKALSALSQAVTLNVALDDSSFADTVQGSAGTSGTQKPATGISVGSLLNTRMNVVTVSARPANYTIIDSNTAAPSGGGTNPKASEGVMNDADTYMFFNDGIMFAYKSSTAFGCTNEGSSPKLCEGIIDVNGLKGPNKVVTCSGTYTAAQAAQGTAGQAGYTPATEASCSEVANPTDVYPVYFYDQTIVPKSAAAKAVLYGK